MPLRLTKQDPTAGVPGSEAQHILLIFLGIPQFMELTSAGHQLRDMWG